MGLKDATLLQNQPDNNVATPLVWGQMYAGTTGIESQKRFREVNITIGMFMENEV